MSSIPSSSSSASSSSSSSSTTGQTSPSPSPTPTPLGGRPISATRETRLDARTLRALRTHDSVRFLCRSGYHFNSRSEHRALNWGEQTIVPMVCHIMEAAESVNGVDDEWRYRVIAVKLDWPSGWGYVVFDLCNLNRHRRRVRPKVTEKGGDGEGDDGGEGSEENHGEAMVVESEEKKENDDEGNDADEVKPHHGDEDGGFESGEKMEIDIKGKGKEKEKPGESVEDEEMKDTDDNQAKDADENKPSDGIENEEKKEEQSPEMKKKTQKKKKKKKKGHLKDDDRIPIYSKIYHICLIGRTYHVVRQRKYDDTVYQQLKHIHWRFPDYDPPFFWDMAEMSLVTLVREAREVKEMGIAAFSMKVLRELLGGRRPSSDSPGSPGSGSSSGDGS